MKNAEGGTRTPTGCPIRPSNVRVYQFHHFGIIKGPDFQISFHFFAGEAEADGEAVALASGDEAGLVEAAGDAAGLPLAAGEAAGLTAGTGGEVTGPLLTTVLTPNPGIEKSKARNIKIAAKTTVAFSSGFCGPRGPKADWAPPPPKAPATSPPLPDCRRMARTRRMQAKIKMPLRM